MLKERDLEAGVSVNAHLTILQDGRETMWSNMSVGAGPLAHTSPSVRPAYSQNAQTRRARSLLMAPRSAGESLFWRGGKIVWNAVGFPVQVWLSDSDPNS